MVVIHHNDMDGFSSAAIVYRAMKGKGTYIRMGHKTPFPYDKIAKNELVVIVDFCVQEKDGGFKRLLEHTENVIWIDHHSSAINDNLDIPETVRGIRRVGAGACELVWEYFYSGVDIPKAIKLISDFDVKGAKYGTENDEFFGSSEEFIYGLGTFNVNPESKDWDDILHKNFDVDAVITTGQTVLRHRDNYTRQFIEDNGFETELEGYSAIAVNISAPGSRMFEHLKDKYDLMLPFVFDGDTFTVSVYTYSSKIDCITIAKKFGGGGHAQASGFQCESLPFKPEGA